MRKPRQRREHILQLLVERRKVQVLDLAEALGVSAVTIRSDLAQIESQGLVIRTHGGATLVRTPPKEQDIRQKDRLNSELKESIGARAAELVRPGDNVIVDSGTTTLTLARHLRDHAGITVMTNGLNIAWELANAPGVEVLLTGGLLRRHALSLQGTQAEACLNAYSFETLFLGADGLDLQFGLTTHHEDEARLNHRMVERARKVVVLTDSSKFGRVSLHRIAMLEHGQTVITDGGISQEYREGLQQLGVELIVV